MKSTLQMTSRQFGPVMNAEELRKFRRSRHESQGMFWARFGVTQSRGSRFEKGAEIPKPVIILLELYLGGIITDVELKANHPHISAAKRQLSAQRAH